MIDLINPYALTYPRIPVTDTRYVGRRRKRLYRQADLDCLARFALRSALFSVKGPRWTYIAESAGTRVFNGPDGGASTDCALAICSPDGTVCLWTATRGTMGCTLPAIARLLLPCAAPLFDKRFSPGSVAIRQAEDYVHALHALNVEQALVYLSLSPVMPEGIYSDWCQDTNPQERRALMEKAFREGPR